MTYIAVSMAVGALVYIGVLMKQSSAQRADADGWKDKFNIAAVASLVLVMYLTIAIFSAGPGASGISILVQPFLEDPVRFRWWPYAGGYAALAFAALAGCHWLVLKMTRGGTTPNNSLERTREG
jgi:hypothetical protein